MPEINELGASQYADIFGAPDTQVAQGVRFGGGGVDILTDLLAPIHPELPITPPDLPPTEPLDDDGKTDLVDPVKKEGEQPVVEVKEGETVPDIVEAGEKKGPGRPKAKEINDASDYFADRIKSGKFVAIKETLADGTEADFIPKTAEEFDEVLDIQVQHQLNAKIKELDTRWYSSKTPAFQAVAKYAELTDNPADIIPFLEGIRNIESVQYVDETTIEGAETIVRARLEQRGEAQDIIEETVESLKTTDKLLATAAKYKPSILAEESRQLQQMIYQKQQEEREYNTMIAGIQESAYKAIEAPIFGKQKLKQDEKADIYDLIGRPSQETGGFAIYTAIDNLFEKGNFETLKKIALLLVKEEAFVNYISNAAADKTAGELQKRLKAVTENRGTSGDAPEEDRPTVKREQFTHQPRFGR